MKDSIVVDNLEIKTNDGDNDSGLGLSNIDDDTVPFRRCTRSELDRAQKILMPQDVYCLKLQKE